MASAASESKIVIKAQDEASATLDRIHTKLMGMQNPMGAMTRKLTDMAQKASPSVTNLGNSFARMNDKLASVGLGVGLGAAGLAVSAAGAFQSVVKTAAEADRIGDLGGRLQLNAEQFQVFEKLAKDSGASIEEVGGAFLKFRLNLSQAESEGGEKLAKLQKALGVFGLSYDEARKMPPLELAKKLGQISADSGTEKDAELKIGTYRQLFGKTGTSLIPVFEAVGTSYNKTLEGMTKAGTLFTDKQVEQGSQAYKRWEKAQQALQGVNRVFGLAMLPAFEKFSDAIYQRAVANRKTLSPVFEKLGDSLVKNIDPLLDGLTDLVGGASAAVKGLAYLAGSIGASNLAMGAGLAIAAPFIAALGSVGVGLWKVGAFFATPVLSWLGTTQAGLWAVSTAANVAWASFVLPVAAVVAGIALVWANLDTIGNYLTSITKRVTEATDRFGVFAGVGQMVYELLTLPFNALIGTLNTVLDLLAKVGIGSGGNLGFVGDAKSTAQQRVSDAAWGNEGRSVIPATAPVTSRQEVNGTVRVQLDKGLIPTEVKSDNRSFSIDAIAGAMSVII